MYVVVCPVSSYTSAMTMQVMEERQMTLEAQLQDSAAQLAVARQEVAAQRDAVAVAETEISQLRAAAEATTARRDQEYERESARAASSDFHLFLRVLSPSLLCRGGAWRAGA